MIISHIVAVAQNGVIGKDNQTPWQVEGELSRFRELTMGHYLLMGRRTYQGLPKVLDGRKIIVLSKTLQIADDAVSVARSLDAALAIAERSGCKELFIGGGGKLYQSTMHLLDKLYLTRIALAVEGDTYYPIEQVKNYRLIYSETFRSNASYTYQTYLTPKYEKLGK